MLFLLLAPEPVTLFLLSFGNENQSMTSQALIGKKDVVLISDYRAGSHWISTPDVAGGAQCGRPDPSTSLEPLDGLCHG
jgi:hypothetical protein